MTLPRTLGYKLTGMSFPSHGRIFSILNFPPVKHEFFHLLVTTTTFLLNYKMHVQIQTLLWNTRKQAFTGLFFMGPRLRLCFSIAGIPSPFLLAELLGVPMVDINTIVSRLLVLWNLNKLELTSRVRRHIHISRGGNQWKWLKVYL